MPLTVTRLARACGLSRSTVLYYEAAGLLKPARRTHSNYRSYSDSDLERLRQICVYRRSGLTIADIRTMLDGPRNNAAAVLHRRMLQLSAEIERLREHQRAIARLVKDTAQLRRMPMVTKEKWTQIMSAAGFSHEDMMRWHAEFERSAPGEHQEFLEFLHLPPAEIAAIRESSRRTA